MVCMLIVDIESLIIFSRALIILSCEGFEMNEYCGLKYIGGVEWMVRLVNLVVEKDSVKLDSLVIPSCNF